MDQLFHPHANPSTVTFHHCLVNSTKHMYVILDFFFTISENNQETIKNNPPENFSPKTLVGPWARAQCALWLLRPYENQDKTKMNL